jgi:hypothetical protein
MRNLALFGVVLFGNIMDGLGNPLVVQRRKTSTFDMPAYVADGPSRRLRQCKTADV